MLDVVMFDLGGTLVSGNPLVLFPGVSQALTDIPSLVNSVGLPISICLVSNFTHLPTPASPSQVVVAESEYRAILNDLGLDTFFSPFEKRVTLSTHLGVAKPDCRVFQLALLRLERGATPLTNCLLITEEAAHVEKVRGFGMKALRFGPAGTPGVDFSSWSDAKARIVAML